MKYIYREGVEGIKKSGRAKWVILPLLLLLGGGYILLLAVAPVLPDPAEGQVAKDVTSKKPEIKDDRLYIPSINVAVTIVGGDSPAALEQGAWHRKPENGDPVKGGNFVLSAHRFTLGWTPRQTQINSPFYHIDKIQLKDQMYVDFQGKRYAYEVSKLYKVDKKASEIEHASVEPKMTLYSCDLRGENAGRVVVEAKPMGIVEWDEQGAATITPMNSAKKVAGASIVR